MPQKVGLTNIISCDDKIIIKMYNWLLTYECDKYVYQAYAIQSDKSFVQMVLMNIE